MAMILSIGIDLGRDTLKLAYAYKKQSSEYGVAYGKLDSGESVRHVAIPAVAYYGKDCGWLYGNEVEKGEEKPFINVVKIKALLSLLYPEFRGGKIYKKDGMAVYPNSNYYFEGNQFPKFFFPQRRHTLENFAGLIKEEATFDGGATPQAVCRGFFDYVYKIVSDGIRDLQSATGINFDELKIGVVHPSLVGDLYVGELTKLVRQAFGKAPSKVMNSGRAISLFANERRTVARSEELLIFDMGEDTLSTQKCFINDDGKVVVEPAADHLPPVNVGGNDVDFAIAEYIEKAISRRETVGSPSCRDEGHIYEEGLQAKQYLFLKEIKKAKLLLSIPSLEKIFAKGVPVSLHRDLYIQLTVNKQQLKDCVGVTGDTGIAREVLNYIVKEMKLAVNADVKNILLTGGLVETCGLLEYLKAGIRKERPAAVVRTFDDNIDNGDSTVIQTYEDSVYASSVGAALAALKDYEVSSALAYSYGTWMSVNGVKILEILVGRGHVFDETKSERLYATCSLQGTLKEEFFSVRLSKGSIEKRLHEGKVEYINSRGITYLCIGEPNSSTRRQVEKMFQLKNITGPNAKIVCTYNGREIADCEPRLRIKEGVITTPDSKVMKPFVEKNNEYNRMIRITYSNGFQNTVKENEILVKFTGVDSFEGETD